MNLYHFLKSARDANWTTIIVMSVLSGLSGGAILAIVNTAASAGAESPTAALARPQLVLMFSVVIALYAYSKWYSATKTAAILEHLVTDLRLRVCEKICITELETIEQIDKSAAFTAITQDASLIAQSGTLITNTTHQGVILIAGSIYLAMLSTVAFFLFVLAAGLGAWRILDYRQSLLEAIRRDTEKQAELFGYLSDLMDGFKEIKLNTTKGEEISREMRTVANASRSLRIQTSHFYAMTSLLVDISLYMLIGGAVFILPEIMPTYSDVLVKTTVTIMFVFAPMATVVGSMPYIATADTALRRLLVLEEKLDAAIAKMPDGMDLPVSFADFQTVKLSDVRFSYTTSGSYDPFSVGPVNLEIHKGETIFVVGGNGSGKTTTLKLIAGLYEPKSGTITVDDLPITRALRSTYRSLFSGVFSDFHLFNRLYGVGKVDQARANDLLVRMGMAHKVKMLEDRFSTVQLSTGQRKRLGMIASLLEDRLIYIFDEWTADQDPHFREEFYDKILGELKANGKTVIAITHDDRYWDRCDRLIKLDYGQVIPMEKPSGLNR